MFDYFRMGLDKNQVRDLNISKQDLMTLFIDPRTQNTTSSHKETHLYGLTPTNHL
jgi:hypothetical protein